MCDRDRPAVAALCPAAGTKYYPAGAARRPGAIVETIPMRSKPANGRVEGQERVRDFALVGPATFVASVVFR